MILSFLDKSRNVNNNIKKKNAGRTPELNQKGGRDVSSSSSASTSSGRYRGPGPEANRAGAPTGRPAVVTSNASAAAVSRDAATAVRKTSGPLQKTVWGKPVVETVDAAKTTNAPASTAVKSAWGPPAKTAAPVEVTPAPPKSVWGQPAQVVEIPKPEQAAAEKKDNEPAKKSDALPDSISKADTENSVVVEPEDQSLKKSSQSIPPANTWASAVASGKPEDPVKASALPPTAAWAKTGTQSQSDVTQTALAEDSSAAKNSSVPSSYVAPKAPWANPEIPKDSGKTEPAVLAPVETVETQTAVQAVAAPVEAVETQTVVPAVISVDNNSSAVEITENVAKDDQVSSVEVPVENHVEISPTPTPAIEPELTNNVDESPKSGELHESGDQTPTNHDVSKTNLLDQNSNKTDEVNPSSGLEEKPVTENDSSSSSKSGSQIKLKYSYKDGTY